MDIDAIGVSRYRDKRAAVIMSLIQPARMIGYLERS